MRRLAFFLLCVIGSAATAADDARPAVPSGFASFEHLTGPWKGTGIPAANRLKGWRERHFWAWKFQDGAPVGMTLKIEGGKVLAEGQLAFEAATKRYRLEGKTPEGKPITLAGTLDDTGQTLTLDRAEAETPGVKERITLRLSSNKIRYTMWLDRQEPGAPQFQRIIDINVGKEGEDFAAGSSSASAAKCILTGGAASMTVSFEGKSYPICCTGCRDEFLENPTKYVKLAALKAERTGNAAAKPARASGPDDGGFDRLVESAQPPSKPTAKKEAGANPKPAEPDAKAKPADPASAAKKEPAADPAARAAALLRTAQSLEKLGKTASALDYYRQLMAKYPGTAQAKTAADRIKKLAP